MVMQRLSVALFLVMTGMLMTALRGTFLTTYRTTLVQFTDKEAVELSNLASASNASGNASGSAGLFSGGSADFRTNFQGFLATQPLRKFQDVYVTMGDGAYARYLPLWSNRLVQLGLPQQVVVCLDEEAQSVSENHNLAAIDRHGNVVRKKHGRENHVRKKHGKQTRVGFLRLPIGVSTLKFLVPKLLLEQGFHRVVFMEGDVYFFGNPTAHYPSSSVSYASMDNGRRTTLGTTNIGFMVFSGKGMLKVIDDFLGLWDRQFAKVIVVAQDQNVFQGVLRKYPQGKEQVFFNNSLFALGPNQVKAETLVVHFAYATASCKRFLLDALYDHKPTPEAFVETVKDAHGKFRKPAWMEC